MDIAKNILKSSKTIAIVGLSPDKDRLSYEVATYLQQHGYRIIPVNPRASEILGEKCYPDLSSIPQRVDLVDIFRRSEEVFPIVKEAIKAGIKFVWMQEGVINEEAAQLAGESGVPVVMDKCTLKEHKRIHKQEE